MYILLFTLKLNKNMEYDNIIADNMLDHKYTKIHCSVFKAIDEKKPKVIIDIISIEIIFIVILFICKVVFNKTIYKQLIKKVGCIFLK